MEQIPCIYCGDFFDSSPRHKNQTACKKEACQKAKKAACRDISSNTIRFIAPTRKAASSNGLPPPPGIGKSIARKTPKRPSGIESFSGNATAKRAVCRRL